MMIKVDKELQYKHNPRKITGEQIERLEDHLKKFGDLSGVVFCRNNKAYVGGNQRSKIFDGSRITILEKFEEPQADRTIAIGFIEWNGSKYLYREVDYTEDEFREACIVANNDGGSFDWDILAAEWDKADLMSYGLDISEFEHLFPDDEDTEGKREQKDIPSLNDRFIVPPFSILDTRQGYWIERKRQWLDLGIKSEVGRESELTFNRSAQSTRVYEARNEMRERSGEDPSWDEIFDYCNKHNIPVMNCTSIFDPVLCELAYRWFNIPNGFILDPFAGGSVRGIVAAKLGMKYYGVDLRKEQIDANYGNASELLNEYDKYHPYWVCDDSLNIKNLFFKEKFDLLFSCPPYADLEVYSDDPRDLSNMDYKDFLSTYRTIIQHSCELLNDNSFAVFVVGEVREKNGGYYGFVQDTIAAFRDAGLIYYNEMILVNQIGSLALRVTKQFNNSRKTGKCHQNVLVFYKGDLKSIKDKYPALDFTDEDLFLDLNE